MYIRCLDIYFAFDKDGNQMKYRVSWENCPGAFAVPDSVVDDSLKLASGKSVKVLLYLIRNRELPSPPEDIGVTAEDVDDALSYWEQVGVIRRCSDTESDGNSDQRTAKEIKDNSVCTSADMTEALKPVFPQSEAADVKVLRRQQKAVLPSEISERLHASENAALLFKGAEEAFSRTLNFEEQRTLLWINDYLGLSPHVVIMLIGYCVGRGKRSMAYIEKTAIDWHDRSINTPELAERELLRLQKSCTLERKVVSLLELNRKLTTKEMEYISQWADRDITPELILYAYDLTIPNTGKVSFNYMNKILITWNDKGVRTVEEAIKLNEETRPKAKQSRSHSSGSASAPKLALPSDIPDSPSYDLGLLLEHAKNTVPRVMSTGGGG